MNWVYASCHERCCCPISPPPPHTHCSQLPLLLPFAFVSLPPPATSYLHWKRAGRCGRQWQVGQKKGVGVAAVGRDEQQASQVDVSDHCSRGRGEEVAVAGIVAKELVEAFVCLSGHLSNIIFSFLQIIVMTEKKNTGLYLFIYWIYLGHSATHATNLGNDHSKSL